MQLFELVSPRLFRPLAGPNRRPDSPDTEYILRRGQVDPNCGNC